jgi:amino acid adenylation domain-containing protein
VNPAAYLQIMLEHSPECVLFVEDDNRLTATLLDSQASSLSRYLLQSGINKGDNVAIYLPRGIQAVIAIYAVLRVGACYIPLDTTSPADRNAFIVKDACCRAVIGKDELPAWVDEAGVLGINFVDYPVLESGDNVQVINAPDDPAAILYTSGSTGKPKGVVISQRAITAFVTWSANTFNLSAGDCAASLSPFHFDLSLFDIFAVPSAAATTVFIPDALKLSPSRLTDWLNQNRINLWYTVPSILVFITLKGGLDKKSLPHLKIILFAGEVFPVTLLQRLTDLLPETAFYNLFGPTETNVCLYWPVNRQYFSGKKEIPVGVPACEAELSIDPDNGELLVKGPCLMSGYWKDGRCERVTDVHGWFHSGDKVSINANQEYEYHGRLDRMIKSSGYRIEPAEIEHVLNDVPGIITSAVIGISDSVTGTRVAAAIEAEEENRKLLQMHVKNKLSPYMRPFYYLYMKKMPCLPNGKKDYQKIRQEIQRELS